jgi:hypothetical protein
MHEDALALVGSLLTRKNETLPISSFSFLWHLAPYSGMASPFEALRSHSQTPHSVELLWTSDHPDAQPYNTQHSQETFRLPAGIEPAISVSERPQAHALDRAATRIGCSFPIVPINCAFGGQILQLCCYIAQSTVGYVHSKVLLRALCSYAPWH